MATELPEDLAEKLDALGEPMAAFALSGRRLALNAVFAPLGLVLGVVLLVLPFAPLIGGGRPHVHLHLLLLGVFLVVAPVVFLARAWQNRGLRILVYPEGLVRLRGGEATAFFWNEITTVWKKPSDGHWEKAFKGSLVYTLSRANGQEIHFDDQVTDLRKLGEIIERQTLPYLLPRAQAACQAWDMVHFGKISVGRATLIHDKHAVPWDDIRDVKIEGTKVMVRREGKWLTWASVPLSEVPNPHVLMALVEQLRPAGARAQ